MAIRLRGVVGNIPGSGIYDPLFVERRQVDPRAGIYDE